ncbi:hypothetical protein PoB_000373100 [Plakobranchus ocellatus]|uniref:BLOC-1-related complex subunit 7 n=1 Tax=Plakobranchus ocellatus TaxID=259542 RepID=A0AAV3XKY1_9GAST|nr:hypothetical protein PoB_000373100 [Plakobranchus ocellatus]
MSQSSAMPGQRLRTKSLWQKAIVVSQSRARGSRASISGQSGDDQQLIGSGGAAATGAMFNRGAAFTKIAANLLETKRVVEKNYSKRYGDLSVFIVSLSVKLTETIARVDESATTCSQDRPHDCSVRGIAFDSEEHDVMTERVQFFYQND